MRIACFWILYSHGLTTIWSGIQAITVIWHQLLSRAIWSGNRIWPCTTVISHRRTTNSAKLPIASSHRRDKYHAFRPVRMTPNAGPTTNVSHSIHKIVHFILARGSIRAMKSTIKWQKQLFRIVIWRRRIASSDWLGPHSKEIPAILPTPKKRIRRSHFRFWYNVIRPCTVPLYWSPHFVRWKMEKNDFLVWNLCNSFFLFISISAGGY